MNDFTLIIPTYNRQPQVLALVRYLLRSKVPWRIMVLNSGEHIADLPPGNIKYLRYAKETHPFDKFLDGARGVTTEYCGICADDDMVVPSGIDLAVRVLREHPHVAVANGHAFGFEHVPKDAPVGTLPTFISTLRIRDSIMDALPLQRVGALLGEYRALTYAVYRTKDMIDVLKHANDMPSLLGRELLSGALAAVKGPVAMVPCFSHGRSVAITEHNYKNWHPTNWFLGNADELMQEYRLYRAVLTAAIRAHPDNTYEENHIKDTLNLIHLKYLINYFPADVLAGLIEKKGAGLNWQDWQPELRKLMENVDSGPLAILGSNAIEEVLACLKLYGAPP